MDPVCSSDTRMARWPYELTSGSDPGNYRYETSSNDSVSADLPSCAKRRKPDADSIPDCRPTASDENSAPPDDSGGGATVGLLAGIDTSTPSRPAFQKRERMRNMQEIQVQYLSSATATAPDDTEAEPIVRDSEKSDMTDAPSTRCHKNIQVNPSRRSRGVNTKKPSMKSVAIQCQLLAAPPLEKLSMSSHSVPSPGIESSESDSDPEDDSTADDPDYIPDMDDDLDELHHFEPQPECLPHKQRVCLVYEECLLALFSHCPRCQSECKAAIRSICGTLVEVFQKCLGCDYHRVWDSQPYIRNIPAGNIMLSAAMLFTGVNISKTLRFLNQQNILSISYQTFLNHQQLYLMPAVEKVWLDDQTRGLCELKLHHAHLTLAGDGRADSPGHSAKYGSYTLLEATIKRVIHIELVTVTEVSSSNAMEKEGLVRALQYLEAQGLVVKEMITDRHVSIRKYLREQKPAIRHSLDVWHVAKGLSKKVDAISRQKGMERVALWKRSINNFIYWCASSTPSGDRDALLAKWDSLRNHVQNIHRHQNPLFPTCLHGKLTGRERRKKWMEPNTKPTEKLMDVLEQKALLKDVAMLSTSHQTSSLESYHAVINHFAPKLLAYSHAGMNTRLRLAALHFNENAARDQATTKAGASQYKVTYPKFKKGGHTVKTVQVACTYNYIAELRDTVYALVAAGDKRQQRPASPPTMASLCERPSKADAVASLCSRFGN